MSTSKGSLPGAVSCNSYAPGHCIHWIHAKKALEDQLTTPVSIIEIHADGQIEVEADSANVTLWNHRPDALFEALVRTRSAAWNPVHRILAFAEVAKPMFHVALVADPTRAPHQLHRHTGCKVYTP